ncbi:pyruvate ferredoxin oxidoreductase, alpha subunit [Methanocella conradii HZ254]|uniref:Pyruvate ferredoxin oxidoreductase, alpha subunit n=1 Tax=Methanocella conradii (strain DSM 24694 / JCM 17849 / CGMCC 1.5162 / HZ254) TaxID=1041930 RepID=H8I9Q8_METCZ|nr:2-ketoisovalerate ferredoxin oxidoreductase subunit alpha [Methanocella conradii]AFD00509.1 pyruvate ferredoxin oxidoreductase, alpha subunit [Methanocella conradii HZ254]
MKKMATGNQAAALAVKESNVEVVAAYPITPQTEVVETIASLVETGKMNASYIRVESEHSALAACIGASASGARAFTATSSHGLLYMHEMIHWAAGARLPIVMANINRAIGPAWNIWADHSDSLSQRDTGWMQFYAATVQEVYDTILMSYRLAEKVCLPAMVCLDGFILSHAIQPLDVTPSGDFIPPISLPHALDTKNPMSYGNLTGPNDYFKFRRMIHDAMKRADKECREVEREFAERFGRKYGPVMEYRTDDADTIIVGMGTMAREAEVAVDLLRKEGLKVGSMRVRQFRPFPRLGLEGKKVVALDRDCSYGAGGILAQEIRFHHDVPVYNIIAGIGGQDVRYEVIAELVRKARPEGEFWLGVD